MANHPTRCVNGGPAANPAPSDILSGRDAAGLTQSQAAALVHGSLRAWQQWEAGDRRMHAGLWELFQLKSALQAAKSVRQASIVTTLTPIFATSWKHHRGANQRGAAIKASPRIDRFRLARLRQQAAHCAAPSR